MEYNKRNLLTLIQKTLHNPTYADTDFYSALNKPCNIDQIVTYFDKQTFEHQKNLVLRFFLLSLDSNHLVSKTNPDDPKFTSFLNQLDFFQSQTINVFKYHDNYQPAKCIQSFDYMISNEHENAFMQTLVYPTFDLPIYHIFVANHSSYHFGSDLNHRYLGNNLPHVNPLTGKHYNYKDLENATENDVTVCWRKNNVVRLLQTIIDHYDLFHINYEANTGINSNLFSDVSTIRIEIWDDKSYYGDEDDD